MSLASTTSVPSIFQSEFLNGIDLHEVCIKELQFHLSSDSFTSEQLAHHYLKRIHKVNPFLEAVVQTNPETLDIASSLDTERRQCIVRGPLHGIPVLVKDNMATKDQMQTTAGSYALLGSTVPRDAHVVSLLRKAGAIIIGHSNMDEWAGIRSSEYSAGYSPRGGQTRNPYDLRKDASGSSSGSAVAVSSNMIPLAFGTETDSSIIWPAMFNGVVGIKPTVGLTSRAGVIPVSENMDSVGPIARTVADAAIGLAAITGQDPRDRFTMGLGRHQETDYASFLTTREALKGARFGLPMKSCWDVVAPDCKAVASRLLDAIRNAGAEIVEVEFPSINGRSSPDGNWNWKHGSSEHSEGTVIYVDAYNNINDYLSELINTDVKTVEDVVEYNRQNSGTEGANPGDHPAFAAGQDNLEGIAATKGIKSSTYHSALAHMRKQTRENGIDAALCYNLQPPESDSTSIIRLDALLMCDRKGIGQQYAAQAGYPIVVIPIGLDARGIPVGLSLHQSSWREGELIKWASAIEDLWKASEANGGGGGPRKTPGYRNWTSKNVPIEYLEGSIEDERTKKGKV